MLIPLKDQSSFQRLLKQYVFLLLPLILMPIFTLSYLKPIPEVRAAAQATDTAISGGTTYYYEVTALNADGESPFSNEAGATPTSAPSAPINLVATSEVNKLNLSWSTPISDGGSPITGYEVYRGTYSGTETLLVTLGVQLYYADSSVAGGTAYYYKVTARNSVGESGFSNEAVAIPVSPPTPPQNPVATGQANQILVQWSTSSNNGGAAITNYKLYRGTSSGAETLYKTLDVILNYTDTSLSCQTIYYFQLTAINSAGESVKSGEVSAASFCAPSPPENPVATGGVSSIFLSWQTPVGTGGSSIIAYKLYRGASPGGESLYQMLGIVFSYTDSGVDPGITYYYKVTAVNAAGESAFSSEVNAVRGPVAAIPSLPIVMVALSSAIVALSKLHKRRKTITEPAPRLNTSSHKGSSRGSMLL